MPINAAHLLNYPVPEVRHSVARRDSVFYALSIGLGQDPVDCRQLDYVDQSRPLKVMPSWAVVLGYPGFWLGNPATGVDAVRLVHGEQSIELHAPLPVAGEIIGRTRITGLVDKGVGKGALLYSEKQLTDAATGKLLATTRSTTFLRGDGGFSGSAAAVVAGPVPHVMPDTAPDQIIDLVTRPEQALLYRLNGDDNPLHSDPALAVKAGFPRPILHGLCTFGVVCHAVVRGLLDYDAARLTSFGARFTAPVYPGETIRTELWHDGSFRARIVERDVVVLNNGRARFRQS